MTARDMIRDALQEIGALGVGEAVTDADAQAGLVRLNSLIDTWQTERLTIYNLYREVFSLVASQASYTIGPTGADFTCAVRPTFIQHAGIIFTSSGTDTEIPIKIITDDEYAALRIKAITSTLPTKLYYNPTFPLGTIYLWPVPSDSSVDLALYIPVPLTAGLSLNSNLVLAPSYEEAVRYNLAIRLAPIFGRPVDATVGMLSTESKATLKRSNQRADEMRVDEAIVSQGAAFNIWTGGM